MKLTLFIKRNVYRIVIYIFQFVFIYTILLFFFNFYYNKYEIDLNNIKTDIKNRKIIVNSDKSINFFEKMKKVEYAHYLLSNNQVEIINKNISNLQIYDKNKLELELVDGKYIGNKFEILVSKTLYEKINSNLVKLRINNEISDLSIVGIVKHAGNIIILSQKFIYENIKKENIHVSGCEIIVDNYDSIIQVKKELDDESIVSYIDENVQSYEINKLCYILTNFKILFLFIILFAVILSMYNIKRFYLEYKNNIFILKCIGVYNKNISKLINYIFFIINTSSLIASIIILIIFNKVNHFIFNIKQFILAILFILFILSISQIYFYRKIKKNMVE